MDGKVFVRDGRRIVCFERYLKHPVEKVWEAITRPDQLAQWLTVKSELDLNVDGQLVLRWDNGDEVTGKFTKVEAPYELEYTWLESSSGNSVVRWMLKEEGDGCMLQLMHTFPESVAVIDFLSGWYVHLDVLDTVLHERFTGFPDGRVKEMRKRYASMMS
ncbi:SRPBCC family protein [Paenibacillus chungangensis]|uniref:SRPBCC family protein n=1 Tax=Paenibacillus chungangensis TaxID=696535 RepID=A0ABW3HQX7_9BACL